MNAQRWYWLVLVVAAAVLLTQAASAPLIDPDESRFARTSIEMLRSGDLVVPRFGGEARLVKPPLVHWIQSFLFRGLGHDEWVARLHSALATLGAVVIVGGIARRRFGDEGAAWAAAVMATIPLVMVLGKVGTLDAMLAVHVLAAVSLDLTAGEGWSGSRAVCLGALLGLGFLVKGPVALALPLLLVLAGRTAAGLSVVPTPRLALSCCAALAAVVLPWAIAFAQRVGWTTATGTLREEAFERYFVGTTHVEPVWYYGKLLPVALLPWTAPLVVGLVRAFRLRREPTARTAVYLAAALLAGVVFFSLGRGKLPNYVLPLAPLAALLVTWELAREVEAPQRLRLGGNLLVATLGAAAVLLGLAGFGRLDGASRDVALAGAGSFLAGALAAGHGALRHRPRQVYGAAAAATGALLLVAAAWLFPAVADRRSAAGLVRAVPELSGPAAVATIDVRVPSLAFYLDRPLEQLDFEGLREKLSRADDGLFVLVEVDLPSIPAALMAQLEPVGGHGKYRVFRRLRRGTPDP